MIGHLKESAGFPLRTTMHDDMLNIFQEIIDLYKRNEYNKAQKIVDEEWAEFRRSQSANKRKTIDELNKTIFSIKITINKMEIGLGDLNSFATDGELQSFKNLILELRQYESELKIEKRRVTNGIE